jgi:hypothetical protein
MYSAIIFLLTLLQLIIVAGSYTLQVQGVFLTAIYYGSPFYLLMTMISPESIFSDKNPLYLVIFGYHVIKYFLFFKAQYIDDGNWRRTLAVIMEGIYLGACAYYLN